MVWYFCFFAYSAFLLIQAAFKHKSFGGNLIPMLGGVVIFSQVLLVLVFLSRALISYPLNNNFYYSTFPDSSESFVYLFLVGIFGFLLFRSGYFRSFFALIGIFVFSLIDRNVMTWHSLALTPFFLIFIGESIDIGRKIQKLRRIALQWSLLVFYLVICRFHFGERPWTLFSFVREVFAFVKD
jgi:hypothetical protein